MNDINKILKKYNYTSNKIKIIKNIQEVETNNGTYIIKKNINKNTRDLFNYLTSKDFNNYLDYLNDDQDDFLVYPYVKNIEMSNEEKASDIIKIISILHNKTVYESKMSIEEIKKDYEELTDEIENLNKYYDNIRLYLEEQQYPSPEEYYLLRNISWVFHSLNSSKYFLDKYYEIVKNIRSRRICLIHGNIELDHLIENSSKYLISWDNSRKDIPIIDLIEFYKNNYKDMNFVNIFRQYEEYFPLLEEERLLLFSYILIPEKLEFAEYGIEKMIKAYDLVNYLKSSSEIISYYHSGNTNNQTNE